MKTHQLLSCLFVATLCAWSTALAQVSVSIGTLQLGESVTITYEVTIDSPLSPAITQISSQGTVSGSNFSDVLTDDPETPAANDATITTLQNDAPVVTAGDVVAYTEQGSAPAVSPALTVTDIDSANLVGGTVSITAGFLSGDELAFTDQNGISGSYNSGTGVLTLTGSSSVANYQTALRSVTFLSSSDNPTASGANLSRTVSFVVNDGLTDSAPATSTINITGVNDAPVVTSGNTIGYTENGTPVAISPALTVTDDGANIASAVVFINAGFVAGDTLGFADQNGITGLFDGNTGVLALSGSSSVANYQAALRSVTFASSSDNPTASGANPSRTVRFVVTDTDSVASAPADTTINITAVNDNPVAGADTIQRGPNDDTKVRVVTLLQNDSDAENGTLAITGVSSATPGVIVTLNGDWVYYRHAGTTVDSFDYTLSDGQGGTSIGTVNVVIQGQDTQSGPALTPTVDGTGAHVSFDAIPGRTYIMQTASNPAGPWTDSGTATEATPGRYTFTDAGGSSANFYRAVYR